MEALVEVHDESELERAKKCGSRLIGINNRDLDDFSVDIARSVRLKKIAGDDCVVVSESGIRTREDIERLKAAGIKSFLVGEGIISRPDISLALKELLGIA